LTVINIRLLHAPNTFSTGLEGQHLQIVNKLKNHPCKFIQFHTHRLKDSKVKCCITGTFMYLPFMAAFPSLLIVSCVSFLTSAILLRFPLLLSVGVTDWVCFIPDSQASSICTVILLSPSSMMLVFWLSQRIKIKLPSCLPFKYLCYIMYCYRRKMLCVKLKMTLSRLQTETDLKQITNWNWP
jgi:hypothetical protein